MLHDTFLRLKTAGFPLVEFEPLEGRKLCVKLHTIHTDGERSFIEPDEGEVIEQLGPDFQSIHRMPNGMFRAVGHKKDMKRAAAFLRPDPLEALAELFIELNTQHEPVQSTQSA